MVYLKLYDSLVRIYTGTHLTRKLEHMKKSRQMYPIQANIRTVLWLSVGPYLIKQGKRVRLAGEEEHQ